MKQNTIILAIVIAIVMGATGFYAGMKYGQQSRRNSYAQFGNGQGGFTRGGSDAGGTRFGGFRPVTGQIISSDAQSITVKLADGSSKIILVTGSTDIYLTTKSTKDDLKTGTPVAVFGTENPDGSVTAQNVQLNPQIVTRPVKEVTPAANH